MYYGALVTLLTGFLSLVDATTIAEIKGSSFLSPLAGKVVHEVTGVVTAKVSNYLTFSTA